MSECLMSWGKKTHIAKKKGKKEEKEAVSYKSTGFVADRSWLWLRGFLGEPL